VVFAVVGCARVFLAREAVFICGERDVPWQDLIGASLVTIRGG
jgi:hypothetical protein